MQVHIECTTEMECALKLPALIYGTGISISRNMLTCSYYTLLFVDCQIM